VIVKTPPALDDVLDIDDRRHFRYKYFVSFDCILFSIYVFLYSTQQAQTKYNKQKKKIKDLFVCLLLCKVPDGALALGIKRSLFIILLWRLFYIFIYLCTARIYFIYIEFSFFFSFI
jgi:hypothetical protein